MSMKLEEFDELYYNKKSTLLMLERVFKPEKYPEFHVFLFKLHEKWILEMSNLHKGASNGPSEITSN